MERPFAAYQGDAPYIFVSYSHADADVIYPEIKRLHEAGFNIWYDEGISPGSTWRDEVALALTQCKLFLFYISPNAIRSENCLQELNFALSRERRVLAVHLEPTELSMGVELSLSNKQAIIRTDHPAPEYFTKLTDALTALLPTIEPIDLQLQSVAPETTAESKSIAILPLVNRSSDEEIEYLCDGVAEELISGLARLDELRVASTLSTFALKNQGLDIRAVGQKLNVSHVLSGSIQKSGERVRVNIALNDVATDHTLWSQRYDGTLEDVFAFQENVARNVVDALQVELGDKADGDSPLIDSGTNSVEAYDAFLVGRHAFLAMTARNLALALEHFGRAVTHDANFGRAHMYRYLCNFLLGTQFGGDPEVFLPRAREAADAMWRTDYKSPFPRLAIELDLGMLTLTTQEKASIALEKIREPDEEWQWTQYWLLATELGAAGFSNGAYRFFRRYIDETPESMRSDTNYAQIFIAVLEDLGRFEECIEFCTQELSVRPDQPLILGSRAMCFSRTGQYRQAEADLKKLADSFPRNFAQFYHLYWTRQVEAANEYYAWLDSRPRLQSVFKVWGALIMGDLDKGFDYIEQSDFEPFTVQVSALRALPQSRKHEVKSHPRFKDILASYGVTESWQQELLQKVNALSGITGIEVRPDEGY